MPVVSASCQAVEHDRVDPKDDLHRYLQLAREALLWKLDGLSEYDVRRPMVPTGTNLLGLVKHVASVEAGYLGDTFGRPFGEPLPWLAEDAEIQRRHVGHRRRIARARSSGFYHRVWDHSDATIDALSLDATGQVPWWPEDRREVTLHRILMHMIAETNRHAGHADIVRELIDGAAGLRADNDNMAPGDTAWWDDYRSRLERAAREANSGESTSALSAVVEGRSAVSMASPRWTTAIPVRMRPPPTSWVRRRVLAEQQCGEDHREDHFREGDERCRPNCPGSGSRRYR